MPATLDLYLDATIRIHKGFVLIVSCCYFPTGSGSLSSAPNNAASNNRCCKAEDRLAILFSAIVTGFLVTNFPRILLNFHEIWVFDNMTACSIAGKP